MSADEILETHIALCDETYQILSEEKNLLRQKYVDFGEDFISRKTNLLERLGSSLEDLKGLNANPQPKSENTKSLINKAQQRLMQILLLDKENERLLTAYQEDTKDRVDVAAVKSNSMDRIQRAYDQYNNPDE